MPEVRLTIQEWNDHVEWENQTKGRIEGLEAEVKCKAEETNDLASNLKVSVERANQIMADCNENQRLLVAQREMYKKLDVSFHAWKAELVKKILALQDKADTEGVIITNKILEVVNEKR